MAVLELPEVGTRTLDLPPDPGMPTVRTRYEDRRGTVHSAAVPAPAEPDPFDVTAPPSDRTTPEGGYHLEGEPPDRPGSPPVRSRTPRESNYYPPELRDRG